MRLRSLLRELQEHGDRVVAWGVVQRAPDPALQTLRIGLGATPAIGPALGAMLFRSRRFLALLSDRRLLLLRTDLKGLTPPHRAMNDLPVDSLGVRRLSAWAVELSGPTLGRPLRLAAVRSPGRPPSRLMDALALLAEDGARA